MHRNGEETELRGMEIIKYKFPPTRSDTQYLVAVLVFAQKAKKTKEEMADIQSALQRLHKDPHNEGVFLVPASWRNVTPYAGTFVIVNNETQAEGGTYLVLLGNYILICIE